MNRPCFVNYFRKKKTHQSDPAVLRKKIFTHTHIRKMSRLWNLHEESRLNEKEKNIFLTYLLYVGTI